MGNAWSRHEASAATRVFDEARNNATKAGNAHILAALHLHIAETEGKQGLVRSAKSHTDTALNLIFSRPNTWLEAWAEHIQLAVALMSCDIDGALARGNRALDLAVKAGVATTYRACLCNYGNLLVSLGRFDEAAGVFERSLTICPAMGDNARGAIEALAAIKLAQGNAEEALPQLKASNVV